MAKLWGARFSKETLQEVELFTSSLALDQRLWSVDIQGSIVHAKMLSRQGVLTEVEGEQLVQALQEIHSEFEVSLKKGLGIPVDPRSEDIHSDIEKKLFEKIGQLAGKLHTGRSRNDQVATDIKLYLKKELNLFIEEIAELQKQFLSEAELSTEVLLPGFTHMQPAQPVSLAHHLLAYFWMFQRDKEKTFDALKRLEKCPLGAAALAGSRFPLDRHFTAKELNFSQGPTENSMDTVSDRDFAVEFLSVAATVMMHLSRFSEELILWSTPAFSFLELGDEVTTGSSIMPQKKNPDVAELIRGRVGLVYGDLIGLLTTLKGLPLSYNRDLQEDKSYLFRTLDTVRASVNLMRLMLESVRWNHDKMSLALRGDFSNATDLADFLVGKGMSFRQAHEVVGEVVQYCLRHKRALEDMTGEELLSFNPLFTEEVLTILPHQAVLQARKTVGGAGPTVVKEQIESAKLALKTLHG
ncbi:MAG: argininosuccinate lyase [Bdellovibrionaceae bacterium]|nr:argininosuccinate lyase [Pseudobdellovibrionaceae bacterium]NUM59640.1 argininosuccinate lyase [Pseudobdellovibrionaceae bacterium]